MCGRFVVTDSTSDLLPELMGDSTQTAAPETTLLPNWNVAPMTDIAIVRTFHRSRERSQAHWGFVPGWAKDFRTQRPQPINARIETVATNGMFKKAFASGRCIIPAQGYYEWVATPDGKEPHYIHRPGGPVAFAGITSAWADPSKPANAPDRWRHSVAIITMDAHITPGEVHDRMPAFIAPDSYDDWLDDRLNAGDLLHLLAENSNAVAADLAQYEVARTVNNVRNNGPELIEPLR